MEIHIKGSVKEVADLIELIRGRQKAEIQLGVDGRELTKAVLGANRDTGEGGGGVNVKRG